MGIYDRDYYRERKGFSPFDSRIQASVILAVIYLCVFLVEFSTRNGWGAGSPITEQLELKVDKVLSGEVWRIATYQFLHDTVSVFPLILNCIFLIMFGRQIEDIYGWMEFLAFYLLAGFLAGLGFLAVSAATQSNGVLLGPVGSITAILFLYALHFPRRTILLFFVLPCPVWFVVAFYVLSDVLGFFGGGPRPAAFAAHVAAASFALVYFRYSLRIANWLPGIPARGVRTKTRPKLHIFRDETGDEEVASATPFSNSASMASAHSPSTTSAASSHASMDEHLEAKLDEVLDKVKKHGQDSLTDEERAVLFRASEIYRKRRRTGGD